VDFRLDAIVQKGSHLQIIGTSLSQQVIADFSRQLEFSNGLFSNLMLSIEGKEVKLDDVADRAEQKEADKKDPVAKDADKKGGGEDLTRVFQFTIDCDYNKPRAEGDKPATQGK
jgi:hypothetical protein